MPRHLRASARRAGRASVRPRGLAAYRLTAAAGLTASLLALAGCAGDLAADTQSAYQRYWQCAHRAAAVTPNRARLAPREVAMRAQAQCNHAYRAFSQAKQREVRSVVPKDDRLMADALAAESALQRRKMVTARLTELVAERR